VTSKSEILDQLPPSDESAERGIIGILMTEPSLLDEVGDQLTPSMFYAESARLVFGRMLALSEVGKEISPATLIDGLKANNELMPVGGSAYLLECTGALVSDWKFYAKKIREAHELRQLIATFSTGLQDSYASIPSETIVERTETALSAIGRDRGSQTLVTSRQAAEDALAEFDKAIANKGSLGLPTGLEKYDSNFGGLFGGQLIVLGARTGVGKSALASQIAQYSGAAGRSVLYVSLEMGATELIQRSICGLAGVSLSKIRSGKVTEPEIKLLSDAATEHSKRAVIFDCRPRLTVSAVRRAARRLARKGLSLIVVDYAQLLTPSDPRAKRYEAIGQITADLKGLAMELGIPVLALAQLSRESEKDGRPRLRHLRESGSIEQDADVVMLLDRPFGGVKEGNAVVADACLDVAKNRSGATGSIYLNWDGGKTMFTQSSHIPTTRSSNQTQGKYQEFANNEGTSEQW
jgi:replicative DNA helicase